ncbi:S8 family peptidase [Paenibacillus terrae]|uniref:S8 family peptidase n=1 Tax=Paenibacillus terrae TaxID=159743 RepID=UPI0011EAFE76|nr:S8 family serine peptidase [Paenibacillus terrae]
MKNAEKEILISLKEGVDPRSVIHTNIGRSSHEMNSEMESKIQRLHSIKPIVKKAQVATASTLESNLNDEKIFENEYKKMSETEKKLYRTYKIKVGINENLEQILEELRNNKGVEHVQLNHMNKLLVKPNDPRYGELYGLINMQCEKAWEISKGEDIVVAVIDSGVDYNHPDIKLNMWTDENGKFGHDFSDKDDDPMDNDLHGTHVAGTIAAMGNNAIGVIGVAPKVKIMAIKVFPNATDAVIREAIKYAVDNGAKIINNSWGPTGQRPKNIELEKVIDYAYEKGVIVVFAAGNENDETKYYSPANYPKTIAVGAVDANDTKAYFSNYDENVVVSAPGVEILSLKAKTNDYIKERMSGTSMAAPHVSGLVALLLSKKPNLKFNQIVKILKESTDDVQTDKYIGTGRVNAYKALKHNLITDNILAETDLVGAANK